MTQVTIFNYANEDDSDSEDLRIFKTAQAAYSHALGFLQERSEANGRGLTWVIDTLAALLKHGEVLDGAESFTISTRELEQ